MPFPRTTRGVPPRSPRFARALRRNHLAFIAEPVGRACLLVPGTEDELRKAVALTDRAVAAKESTPAWIYRYFLFAQGLAEYRQGRPASAISLMEGEASSVMGPAPRLIVAMAQHDQGQKKQARKTLAMAILAFDWSAAQADSRGVWIAHILRREAEALILPNLPAFLQGEYQPLDNDERLALVGICQFQGRCHAAARLYADAFAADPALAEDLTSECRPGPRSETNNLSAAWRSWPPNAVTPPPGAQPWPAADSARTGPSSARRSGRTGARRRARGYGPTWRSGPRYWTAAPRRAVFW